MKLLIVDDNSEMRAMLKNVCSDLFSEILGCTDGDEAVSLYDKEYPDWVLMDIKMARMDGLTATSKIKQIDPEAKVIIISQFKDQAIADAAIKAGAVEFVPKEDLLQIEEVISIHQKKHKK